MYLRSSRAWWASGIDCTSLEHKDDYRRVLFDEGWITVIGLSIVTFRTDLSVRSAIGCIIYLTYIACISSGRTVPSYLYSTIGPKGVTFADGYRFRDY